MLFFFGYIIGILNALTILVVMVYFRRPIEHTTTILQTQIENAGPKPKGYIFEPESEAQEIRSEIIQRNKARGIDTRLSDLE